MSASERLTTHEGHPWIMSDLPNSSSLTDRTGETSSEITIDDLPIDFVLTHFGNDVAQLADEVDRLQREYVRLSNKYLRVMGY